MTGHWSIVRMNRKHHVPFLPVGRSSGLHTVSKRQANRASPGKFHATPESPGLRYVLALHPHRSGFGLSKPGGLKQGRGRPARV